MATLVVLGTGGTIAGSASLAHDNVGYQAAQRGIEQVLGAVASLDQSLGDWDLECEQVLQLDSKDMSHAAWYHLTDRVVHHLSRSDVRSVLITHGTDTIEETAYFLSCVIPPDLLAAKSVVITCSMRPATALAPDGPQNIRDGIAVAKIARGYGVVVVCAGRVHLAQYVQKVHPYALDAFDSGEAGPVAVVEEGRVRWLYPSVDVQAMGTPHPRSTLPKPEAWPRVELLTSHAGASGLLVRALLNAPTDLAGLVVAGTGNGTVHTDLQDALYSAEQSGVQIVYTSRCTQGSVVCGAMAGSISSLPGPKARIALMLELMRKPRSCPAPDARSGPIGPEPQKPDS